MSQELERLEREVEKGAKFLPIYRELSFGSEIDAVEVFRELRVAYRSQETGAILFQRGKGVPELRSPGTHQTFETLLGIDPFEIVRARQGRVRIETKDAIQEIEGCPFRILSERIASYQGQSKPNLPFFQGGALGYFAYDAVRYLEPILTAARGNLRELESSPQGYDAEFMFFGQAILFDPVHSKVIAMSSILPGGRESSSALEKKLVLAHEDLDRLEKICRSARRRPEREQARSAREIPIGEMQSMFGKSGFMKGVRKLKRHIREGDIFQAVLSEKFSVPFAGDPVDLFRILSDLSPAPYRFLFSSGPKVFLGASPEMLLKLGDGVLETHPIAGTRPRGKSSDEEAKFEAQLKRSEKEKSEHLMLVDLARNDIGRVSEPGTVRVESFMEVKKFSGLMHFVSRVTGKSRRGADSIEVLGSCFPAGTLSGAPKIRAMQLLSELEPLPRGFYGGAFVEASFNGDLDSCITIRSIEIADGRATVQAGAGIVADSQPEREYAEVRTKSRTARLALGIARSREAR